MDPPSTSVKVFDKRQNILQRCSNRILQIIENRWNQKCLTVERVR